MAIHSSFAVNSVTVSCQRPKSRWLVIGLLLSVSALALTQAGIVGPSYGQFMTQTTYPPGLPTTWRVHTGNRTWTHMGNHTWIHTGNRTFTRPGNLTWVHTANQTWTQLGNWTGRKRGGGPPGFMNGWAHSNMTIASGNETQAFLLNGTNGIRLGSIAINASSTGQIIRNIAFNDSVVQVEFDREGSVQLIINSSAKPSQVFADNNTLTMAQSISGLTPASEAWVYDQNSHTLIILADPMSITLIYGTATSTPIPEFPPALELMITVGWLAIVLMIRKGLNEHYTSHSAARTG